MVVEQRKVTKYNFELMVLYSFCILDIMLSEKAVLFSIWLTGFY